MAQFAPDFVRSCWRLGHSNGRLKPGSSFMFNSQHYRVKAAEYKNRASKTGNPIEFREYKNLERTFGELADNAEWMEQNSEKIVHAPNR